MGNGSGANIVPVSTWILVRDATAEGDHDGHHDS